MVVWGDIEKVLRLNKDRDFRILIIQPSVQVPVERFPIIKREPTPSVEDDDSIEPLPPTNQRSHSSSSASSAAVCSRLDYIGVKKPVSEAAVKLKCIVSPPKPGKLEVDPIVLGIELKEPLYEESPFRTKHQMECEEAKRIEALLEELYKNQGGRSRGWTKGGLELWVKPRCASGGDIRELDRVKKAFLWSLIGDDKASSAFLDFVCVAKNIRIAVWFLDIKQVLLYPAADNLDAAKTFPLYNITSNGLQYNGLSTTKELVEYCDSNSFVLLPPYSVTHSLGTLSLAELASVGTKLGMPSVEGSKLERIAKVAIYKLRQRLLAC